MNHIKTTEQMQEYGASVAKKLLEGKPKKHARVVALSGDLGAGKTTFAQGFLRFLGVEQPVISPTFLLIRSYPLETPMFSRAYHIDCYRLHHERELLSLGFKEMLKNPAHIILIEWPKLMRKQLPKDTVWIEIEHPKTGSGRLVR